MILILYLSFLAPNTPASNSLLTPTLSESNNSVVKSTNFTGSTPTSRAEIRHKSEIEIEVKHEKPRQTKNNTNNNNNNNNTSPSSTTSSVVRSTTSNKRTPTILFDEQPLSQQYQPITKRRILTNSIQTQTPPLQFNTHDHHVQQQQLKALTDESLSKNEKIQAILRELNDCQVRLGFFFSSPHTASVNLCLAFCYFSFVLSSLCRQSSNSKNNN
jgi:hypothetical protein